MDQEKLALFESIKSTFLHIDAQEKSMLMKHKLSLPRFYILLHVHNHPKINQMELTARMLCTKGNITRILQGMEVEGLIKRVGALNDRRNTLVSLTKSGLVLLYTVYQDYEFFVEELMGRFKPEEIKKYNRDILVVQNTLRPQALSEPAEPSKPVLLLAPQGEEI